MPPRPAHPSGQKRRKGGAPERHAGFHDPLGFHELSRANGRKRQAEIRVLPGFFNVLLGDGNENAEFTSGFAPLSEGGWQRIAVLSTRLDNLLREALSDFDNLADAPPFSNQTGSAWARAKIASVFERSNSDPDRGLFRLREVFRPFHGVLPTLARRVRTELVLGHALGHVQEQATIVGV